MKLLNSIRDFFREQGVDQTYWIALSGGLDSVVLLSLCQHFRSELKLDLRAIHINHGLSANAKEWSSHCKKVCDQHSIQYVEQTIKLSFNKGESIEEIAKRMRYQIFSDYLKEKDILLTAHHQDDQAETFLLQLCRGSGPKGLASMPKIKKLAKGFHARPLLNFTRKELQLYAQENKLIWVEDESNEQQRYSRNFIRHEVLSKLKSRWPGIISSIARSASHCAENQLLLEEFALDFYREVQGSRTNTLSVSKLLQLNPEKQRLVLRTWIHQLQYSLPDTKKLQSIQRDVLTAARDKMPCVKWGNVFLRKYRDDIYLIPHLKRIQPSSPMAWDLKQTFNVSNFGSFECLPLLGKGLSADIKEVTICFRQGGEKVEIPARGHSHSLKKLFQEWNVLPWERDFVPLIYVADKLISVMGYYINENFSAKKEEWGREIVFTPSI